MYFVYFWCEDRAQYDDENTFRSYAFAFACISTDLIERKFLGTWNSRNLIHLSKCQFAKISTQKFTANKVDTIKIKFHVKKTS